VTEKETELPAVIVFDAGWAVIEGEHEIVAWAELRLSDALPTLTQ
jgi:hypothetical protein